MLAGEESTAVLVLAGDAWTPDLEFPQRRMGLYEACTIRSPNPNDIRYSLAN